jgi:hypothetical protein
LPRFPARGFQDAPKERRFLQCVKKLKHEVLYELDESVFLAGRATLRVELASGTRAARRLARVSGSFDGARRAFVRLSPSSLAGRLLRPAGKHYR